tara:strand:+ start:1493 stop:2098 length:606 start_codon:yes stop_codon:yes gene_type:complete
MKIEIEKIKPNESNPRIIKDFKFQKLVKSIKDFPEMLEKRPIVVDENMTVIGGNMRLKACREAGIKKVDIVVADNWTEEQKKEFVIKDNLSYGEWEWDTIANEYDVLDLDTWGMELDPSLFNKEEDIESIKGVTDEKFNDFTIYFSNEEEMDIWYAFLKRLKNKFADHDNVSERVLRYIAEVYDENNMSESKMILKFIDGE